MNWLFVCSGNTCRSPMAAACMRLAMKERGLHGVVTSAGFTPGGEPAAENAVAVMQELGVDISHHRSTPLTLSLCEKADRIAVMSDAHREILARAGVSVENIIVLAEKDGGVADPYGRDMKYYRKIREQLAREVDRLLDEEWV